MAVQLPGRPIQRIRRAVSRAGPESLVGALGATFIGGPALGLGIGILSGRLNAQELDRRAEDEMLVRDANQLMHDSIDVQREQATSPEDLQQLNVIQTAMERAERMLAASSPELQRQGAQLIEKVLDAQLQYETRQETQRIQADATNAAAEAAWGQQNWTRRSGLYDDLFRESSDFIAKRSAYGALIAGYQGEGEPGNVQDIAAINSIQRMIDPGVSVRSDDVSLIQNLDGVSPILLTALNRVMREGGRFTPGERAELVGLGDRLMGAANTEQSARNARFQDFGTAAGLPEGLIGTINIPLTDQAASSAVNLGVGVGTQLVGSSAPVSDEQAGQLVPVRLTADTLTQPFTRAVEDMGSLPPDLQLRIDTLPSVTGVQIDQSGRIYVQPRVGNLHELLTTQAQREAILDIQDNGLSEEQAGEIRKRRRERTGAPAPKPIMRFGPDDTTSPNRTRVTN